MSDPATNIIPFLRRTDEPLSILTVEDSRMERMFLENQISELGHNSIAAENGAEALEKLRLMDNRVDVILMDRLMPVMDGLSAIRLIKADAELRRIPIIMVTGATAEKDIQEGIEAGVFYYLTKPVNENILKSVLLAAGREAERNRVLKDELSHHRASFNLIETCKFQFSTFEQAEALANFMAHCFPDPVRVLPGLHELTVNAIEHGTYDLGYDQKSELIENGTLRAEIKRREGLPEYQGRFVEAVVTHKENGVYAVITDQGQGFAWKQFMTIEPSRARDNHGRGIAQANALSFDKLTYNEKGNQAIGFVSKTPQLIW